MAADVSWQDGKATVTTKLDFASIDLLLKAVEGAGFRPSLSESESGI